ncbi:serine/threonine-protein kinase [Kribbella sp. VKM Ac-2569]|uniref:serine/threonine-protein kinase n=1 Tax=Kribbella sp. VKM Ac-2569 TaxID=2512220 RepID=UPI00102B9EB9|nr:serine/threonine-protein kinase [Kribbella sp. VKM Ac-2569]
MLVAKRYKIGPSIGRGGMGEVYRAEDQQLGRSVAVKLLLPSNRDPGAAQRFQREARAAARLSDPHVVSVYDFGHHRDGFFLVMELVEGPTVAAELARRGRLPLDRAIDIVEQAAAGLAAAHLEGVVHRDVKPGNLLLAEDGTVKVADFGIAHVPGEGATTLTATGQIIGSAVYLAPERARGGPGGTAADVYSLGCVLYQLVTGQPPFTGEHPAAILYQHVDATPAPPSLTLPELDGQFERVLLRMLAKDPEERPSAAEIAHGSLLGRLYAPEIGRVLAASADETTDTERYADPIIAARISAVPQTVPIGRRRHALVAGMVATLATAAAVLAGIVLNANDHRLPPATDVGPQPGGGPSAPVTRTAVTRTAPTDSGTSAAATRKTSRQPSPSASATPRTPSPATTGTTSASTTSPTQSSKTSTRETPSPSPSTSPTPATSSPPSSGTTSPSPQTNATTPASD